MSHTVAANAITYAPVSLTINNYVNGGETVLPEEFSLQTFSGAVFGECPPDKNSLGVPLFPLIVGGKLKLFQFVSGSPVEIATTNALNAILVGFGFS